MRKHRFDGLLSAVTKLSAVAVALLVILPVTVGCGRHSSESAQESSATAARPRPQISYHTRGVTVVDNNPETLQEAVEELHEKAARPAMGLEYKNEAFSENGKDVSCYIANAARNELDMFITLFTDGALKDEIYLSGLLRPGTALESITLDRALPKGDHDLFLVFTQAENIDGEWVLQGQVVVILELHVGNFS